MLSVETEARVAKLLLSLAEGERTVEISRQVLSDNYDFDPYQIFLSLYTECKNRVNACNILNFLKCKGIFANEAEVNFLIQCYDQDGDGSLSYTEFLNLIQSEKSLRKSNSNSCDNKLSFNIEYSLSKLLEKEIDLSRNIMNLLNDLRCRCDYNACDIFNSLKSYNSITPESLKCFLDKNCASYLDSDVRAMMKRMDSNCDGRVDLCELTKLLEFSTCLPVCCDPCPPKCCPPITCCPPKCCPPINCCPPKCCPPIDCCPPKCLPIRCCSPCPSPRRCFSSNNSPIRGDLSRKTENILNNSGMFNTQNSTYLTNANSPMRSPQRDNYSPMRVSNNLSLRLSPQRKFPPLKSNYYNSYGKSPVKLENNCIDSIDKLKCLSNYKIKKINLLGNPFLSNNEKYRDELFELIPSLESIDDKDRQGENVESTEYNEEEDGEFDGEGEEEGDLSEEDEEYGDEDGEGEDDEEDDEDKPQKKTKK